MNNPPPTPEAELDLLLPDNPTHLALLAAELAARRPKATLEELLDEATELFSRALRRVEQAGIFAINPLDPEAVNKARGFRRGQRLRSKLEGGRLRFDPRSVEEDEMRSHLNGSMKLQRPIKSARGVKDAIRAYCFAVAEGTLPAETTPAERERWALNRHAAILADAARWDGLPDGAWPPDKIVEVEIEGEKYEHFTQPPPDFYMFTRRLADGLIKWKVSNASEGAKKRVAQRKPRGSGSASVGENGGSAAHP